MKNCPTTSGFFVFFFFLLNFVVLVPSSGAEDAFTAYKNGDFKTAFRIFTESANKGEITALYNVACMYKNGEGVKQNLPEALRLFRIAKEKGHQNAASQIVEIEEYLKNERIQEIQRSESLANRKQPKKISSAKRRSVSVGFALPKTEAQFFQDSQQICAKEWTTRGQLDERMYNYTLGQQIDAYKELVVLHSQYSDQPFYSEIAFPYSYQEWTKRGISNVKMIVSALNKEIDGFKDVVYYQEKYGKDQVNAVVAKALVTYRSWRMAAYELKKHFE